jgi:hypothetical protein
MADNIVLNFRKAAPGIYCGGIPRNSKGSPVCTKNGMPVKIRIKIHSETFDVQASEDEAPVPHVRLTIDLDGTAYTVRMKLSDLNDARLFAQAMKQRLPDGFEFTDGLRDIAIATSFAPELVPIYDDDFYANEQGMSDCGVRVSNTEMTVVGEERNQYNELLYVVRHKDGRRAAIPVEEMQRGDYHRLDPKVRAFDPLQLFICLKRAWNATTPEQRQAFDDELLRQKQAEVVRQHKEELRRKAAQRFPGVSEWPNA